MHKPSSIIWLSFRIIGHTQKHTNHKTTSTGANVGLATNRHVYSKFYIVVLNIGSLCAKPSLTGLCSRVHNSDETQLTYLIFCTHVNKHLVNNVWQNNFITSYCFWMLPNMLEYTLFWDTRYNTSLHSRGWVTAHSKWLICSSFSYIMKRFLQQKFSKFIIKIQFLYQLTVLVLFLCFSSLFPVASVMLYFAGHFLWRRDDFQQLS